MMDAKNFWLWLGGVCVLAIILLLAPMIPPGSQSEPRRESKTPTFSAEEETWTVDLNSSGGFQGKGGGGAHSTSHGIVYASRFNVMSPRHLPCRSQLLGDDLRTMDRTVSSANASTWKSSYVPERDNGCCDRFHWTLLLFQRAPDRAGRTYGTDWHDGNESQLPDDLAELRKSILAFMKTALSGCTQ